MKKLFTASVMAAGLLMLVGCEGPNPPGGPGAADTHKVQLGTPDDAFKLSVPLLTTHMKQGERQAVDIGISRGKNFDQDVKLEFGNLPQGVKAEPTQVMLKHGQDKAQIMLAAAKDAALGSADVNVTGTPMKSGPATTTHFKISVDKP